MFDTIALPSTSAPLRPKHERSTILGGSLGTAQTIARMQALVAHGKRDITLRRALGQILAGGPVGGFTEKEKDGREYTLPLNSWRRSPCPPKDHYCYAQQIFHFCRDGIRYVYDPHGVELLERPVRILLTGIADCDSICVLFASLCEAAGMPTRFLTVKADRLRPNEYSHVLCEVNVPRRGWIAADCTQTAAPFGWRPPLNFPAKSWPASAETLLDAGADMFSGFGEGPVPGVRYAGPFTQVPGSDITLRGLADLACNCLTLSGMSGLGATPPSGWMNNASVLRYWDKLLSGQLYTEMRAAQTDLLMRKSKLSQVRLAINNMPAGSAKSNAENAYASAKSNLDAADRDFQEAKGHYNTIISNWIVWLKPLGAGNPPSTHLGVAPIAIAAAIALGGAGFAVAMYGLSVALDAFKGRDGQARGFMDYAEGIVKSTGQTVGTVGSTVVTGIEKTTSLVQTLGIIAAVGGAGYVAYKILENRGYIGRKA